MKYFSYIILDEGNKEFVVFHLWVNVFCSGYNSNYGVLSKP